MKYYGKVGYGIAEETSPGVWEDTVTERNYSGDFQRVITKWTVDSNSTNDDLLTNASVSIIADPFAYNHFSQMKYLWFQGVKWKITSVEVQRPRLILTLGGVYNG